MLVNLLLSGLLSSLLGGLLGGLLLVLLLLEGLLRSDLLHDLLLLNEESTENATSSAIRNRKFEHLPITQTLMTEIASVSTSNRALAGADSLHISSRDAGNLLSENHKLLRTPARAFLQQPHLTGLAAFLVYWTTSLAPRTLGSRDTIYQGSSQYGLC